MKFLYLLVGLLFSMSVWAEIYEKPEYTPDEGHLQEEIERQEERPSQEKVKEGKHQDIKRPDSNPSNEKIDDEMTGDEKSSL